MPGSLSSKSVVTSATDKTPVREDGLVIEEADFGAMLVSQSAFKLCSLQV